MSRRGFTLLEVLIAISILAVLSALTAQSIQNSIRVKVKIQKDLDVESSLRSAMRIFERDVSLAFHYQDLDKEIQEAAQKGTTAAEGTTAPSAVTDSDTPNPTQFIGAESSLYLTTLSNVVTDPEVKESQQAEVGYFIDDCEDRKGKCLLRRSSPYLDGDVENGGSTVELLGGIEEFKLKYFGEGKQDWVSSWRTDQGGDDATKEKFPWAVEVSLSVKENNKEYALSSIVSLRFPNNPEKKKTGGTK